MSRILVDTSAYAAHLRDHPEIKAAIQQASEVCLSVVSIGELRAGFLKGARTRRNEELLRRFLASPRSRAMPVDEETAVRYAAIRDYLRKQGTPIPANDVWIAATAAQHGLRLLTLDAHFLRVPQVIVDFVETAPRPQ
ncbi:MAG: type II toxin-antitoxin system VapC family toxin [Chloroflexi bacterium]|nr:type II toxin-antitoxin system VapC family toxin [Chloroflexota bacterium]